MNLYSIENDIDNMIFERGLDYFKNDYIASVKLTEDNVYEAQVEGTDLYNVRVKLNHNYEIIETKCDCPYDMGEYCKHQVAVFLALRVMKESIDSEGTIKSPAFNQGKTNDIKQTLSNMTKDELVEFLLDIASEYEEIRHRIALNFNHEQDEDEIAKAIVLIRTYINNNSDRYGFVTYRGISAAVKGADMIVDKARFSFTQNNNMHAIELALCVIHEMMELLQRADDSDGVIGEVIEDSIAFMSEITANEELSSVDKENIFEKLITESTHRRYGGWADWKLDILVRCSELADTSNLRNTLEQHLLSIINSGEGDSWSVNYLTEKINLIRYHMIQEYDGQTKAQEFIEQNLHYSNFRVMAIEIALKNKEYDYVIKLTLDGEQKDTSWPGLLNQWKKYRYTAFQLAGKLDDQRALAMDFILGGSTEFYNELKNTYDSKDWLSIYPQIIVLLENQKGNSKDVYTYILIEEGERHKLLEYIKGRPSSVETLYSHLIPEFKEEVYMVYGQYIEQAASHAGNRKDYQRVCDIIRKLKKVGGKEQAMEIKQKLFNQYANRPAFRDELSRV